MITENQRRLIDFPYTRETLLTETSQSLVGLDAIRSTSDEKVLGTFKSDQYICPHINAIDRVESAFGEMNITPEVTDFQLLKNGAELYVHYRLPPALSINLGDNIPGVPGSDVLFPEIIVRNGYNGKTMFGLEYGLFRLVCSNGARALVMGNRSTNKRYLGDIDVSVIVAGITEFCETLLVHLRNRLTIMVGNTAPELGTEVREFVVEHYSNKLINFFDQQTEYAEQEAIEAGKDGISEWQYYNICTFITAHMMESYARRRLSEIQIARQFHITVRSNENMEENS
jgi:hypothetical protein